MERREHPVAGPPLASHQRLPPMEGRTRGFSAAQVTAAARLAAGAGGGKAIACRPGLLVRAACSRRALEHHVVVVLDELALGSEGLQGGDSQTPGGSELVTDCLVVLGDVGRSHHPQLAVERDEPLVEGPVV